jgi:hypothetical protein
MAFLATLGVLVVRFQLWDEIVVGERDEPVFTLGLSATSLIAVSFELADGIRLLLLLCSV